MAGVLLDAVSKVYPDGFRAVRDVSLRIPDGELFVLLGPSGCGKSTLLRMVAGLEKISSGRLWLGDRLANDVPARDRDVAMVFQGGALYPHRTVEGNIGFPLELTGKNLPGTGERIEELSRALGIAETLHRFPSTLSGGQRQRVAMGRALIREPGIFLMDEPLSSLDARLRTELRAEIGALVRSLGVTTLYVTHDQTEALTLADRVAIMRRGILQDVGTPQQIYDDPATVFVAAFLSSAAINLLQAQVRAGGQEGVLLDLGGEQFLHLPWNDPRVPALAAHRGSYVTVGLRADTLRPSAEGVIAGRVRALEFHGHEWLAHLETDLTYVAPAGEEEEPPAPHEKHKDGLLHRTLRAVGLAPPPDAAVPAVHEGTHRRTDLTFRLESRSSGHVGDLIRLAVDVDRILLFDQDGHRIDPIHR